MHRFAVMLAVVNMDSLLVLIDKFNKKNDKIRFYYVKICCVIK